MGDEFEKLDTAIRNLAATASARSYGDAAADGPATEVIRDLLTLLEFGSVLRAPNQRA